ASPFTRRFHPRSVGAVAPIVFLSLLALVIAGSFLMPGQSLAQCVTPPSGMVAAWPLDESAGAAVARDVAGFNNSGIPRPNGVVGPPGGPAAVTGNVRGAMLFDAAGSTDGPYFEVAPHPELDFGSSSFTIEA